MFCYNCGREIDDDSQFCPFCGIEQTFEDESQPEEETPTEQEQSVNLLMKKPKVTIAALACVIAACLIGAGITYFISGNSDTKGAMEADNIAVLDCDADWDSAYFDPNLNTCKVDVIMLVKNDSGKDITGVEFNLKDKSGNPIGNALDQEQPFRAEGYIANGTSGIMVAPVWTDGKKKIVPENSFEMLQAYQYMGEDGYVIPMGRITAAKGVNQDFYTVQIDNPNSVDISETSTFVAVELSDNEIKDSDATGRIEQPIAAGSKGCQLDNVFQDPGFSDSIADYIVYAIDSTQYR